MIGPVPEARFKDWFTGIAFTRVFWAKPLIEWNIVGVEDGAKLFRLRVLYRRKVVDRYLVLCEDLTLDKSSLEIPSGVKELFLIVRDEYLVGYDDFIVRRRSILFFWDAESNFLEPNREVDYKVMEDFDEDVVEAARRIQRRSWGFFIPPDPERHTIILALLDDEAVASAYLNKFTMNIDFGVHVVRDLWRRRIGSGVLRKAWETVIDLGGKYMSVIRVLGRSGDKRAILFYKANDPSYKYYTYRLIRRG